jgi:ATP-dependent helicase HrpA
MTEDLFRKIDSQIPLVLTSDRLAAKQQLERIRRTKSTTDRYRRLSRLQEKLRSSIRRRHKREKALPAINVNTDLPIASKRVAIMDAIRQHRVVIVSGDTGSGKSTQIPQYCLQAGRGIEGVVGCTQPRRIAATSIARRIAEELGEPLGQSVGYKIRFSERTSPHGYIKMMTDGILLAEAAADPLLGGYDTVIVDEAHERSLNIDFLLGLLKTLLARRSDLKIIITSATIDTEKFSSAFDHAPVIEVSGRMFPVEVRYMPPLHTAQRDDEKGLDTHIDLAVKALTELTRKGVRSDILVFMPTEADIRETCALVENRNLKGVAVYPLYGRLPARHQGRVFSRTNHQKIIVSTNVAETSLTIPGIKYVIDTGLARMAQYSPRSRTTALPVIPISRSSADQRMGRCGRVQDGVCIRLYTRDDYERRDKYTPPEILRSNLAEVILRMMALNLGDVAVFPFIDAPDAKSIKDGYKLLLELQAIGTRPGRPKNDGATPYRLTRTGRQMARIPLDPRLSRVLIQARDESCLPQAAVIAAALSIQDPRERPPEKEAAADQAHGQFADPCSDFVTYLNIWNRYLHHRDGSGSPDRKGNPRSNSQRNRRAKQFCRQHFLSYRRMREWVDMHGQILRILQQYRLVPKGMGRQAASPVDPPSAGNSASRYSPLYQAIHCSVLSGFLANIALKEEKNIFQAANHKKVMVFPGSGLFNQAGDWIVAAEMVQTTRLFARTVARIDRLWIEKIGHFLCRCTHINPRWEKKRAQVVVTEQVFCFGLPVIDARTVPYGPINPVEATEIFIRQALVEADVKERLTFLTHNQDLTHQALAVEDKVRRRDILVTPDDLFDFYQRRLETVFDVRTLKKVIRQKGGDQFLRMQESDIMQYRPSRQELKRYPDKIRLGSNTYPCQYRFKPGDGDDGLTVKIPSVQVGAIPTAQLDWMVPGILEEKITVLIKGLPKAYRRRLLPVNETVRAIISGLPETQDPLPTALSRFIIEHFGVDIPAATWPVKTLPRHLQTRVAITGPDGEIIHAGRDKAVLARFEGKKRVPRDLTGAIDKWERRAVTQWDFGELPNTIELKADNGAVWPFYPALQAIEAAADTPSRIDLKLFADDKMAHRTHRFGVAALLALHFAKDIKFLKKGLPLKTLPKEYLKHFGGIRQIERHLVLKVMLELCGQDIRTLQAFEAAAEKVGPKIIMTGRRKAAQSAAVIIAYGDAVTALTQMTPETRGHAFWHSFFKERLKEMRRLVPEHFIKLYGPSRLDHLPRYIKAIVIRSERALAAAEKDKAKESELTPMVSALERMLESIGPESSDDKTAAIETYHWLLEEFKVSLFAQELKTAIPVSKKRLEKKIAEIERMV